MTSVGEIIVSDETGFPWNKAKLVESGVLHLRPFNIGNDGQLDLAQTYFVPIEAAPETKSWLLAGDVLFNNTNSVDLVGKSALVLSDTKAAFSNHITRIRVNAGVVDPAFFNYWLRFEQAKGTFAAAATQWVSQAAFRASDMKRLQIQVPHLEKQRRIVDLLSRAEGIVRLRREAQRKTAELVPALFLDMFGDPASNPKGWPSTDFGTLGQLDRGKSRHRPRDAQELYDGPYPFIQTGDVTNSGGHITRYTQTYSELGLAQSRLWPAGTLCITIAANIARTGVLDFNACFPDSVVGFTPSQDVTIEYIQHWLGFLQPTLERNAPQAAQKNINLEILRNLPVPVPPIELQRQFAAKADAVRGIAAQQAAALTTAQATFDALLHQSFTAS